MKSRKVIGNWKMHKTGSQASEYIQALELELATQSWQNSSQSTVGLAVPFTSISSCAKLKKLIDVGAQNMHDATQGAYTGEIALMMLQDAGASFVLLGHSERRQIFEESEEFIARKVKAALLAPKPLHAVICVGETQAQKEAGQTIQAITRQLKTALEDIPLASCTNFSVAYEPVWAIGTGLIAKAHDIEQAHLNLKLCLDQMHQGLSSQVCILYGGSVQESNAREIAQISAVDGLLVGGSSLEVKSFAGIVEAVFTA